MRHRPYTAATVLDRRLGDPEDDGRLFSYRRSAALDDGEEFPLEICRELDFLGLPRAYVPVEYGGDLRGYDEAMQLMRVVSRRDLTVAIAHGKTFLGAVSVWVGGEPEQARRLGTQIADGTIVSWGLTERDHGSDLLAGELQAQPQVGGYLLNGEKWLINNATRGHQVCVLARTDPDGGPRGFSVLLVDRRTLDPASHRPLPAVRLHGIRGADISGIAFTDAAVPGSALVGAEGEGLEIVLKSLQLTRTLCASLSLGAGDQALGMAVDYALERHNFGRPLVDLPQTRRLLTESYADQLLAEAVSLVSGRAIHALTAELPVSSAITKYLVPTLVERMLPRLAKVMGSRALLVGDTYRHGRFQKVQRDHRIVGIFDGSTVVNLHSLVNQFPALVRGHRRARVDEAGLRMATTLDEPLSAFDRGRLELVSRSGSSLVQSLPAALAELHGIDEVPDSLKELATRISAACERLMARAAEHRPTALDVPAEVFELAESYTGCYAAAAALHLWLRNRDAMHGSSTEQLWADGLWLEAALTRALGLVERSPAAAGDGEVFDRLAVPLLAQHAGARLPSLLPYPCEEESA